MSDNPLKVERPHVEGLNDPPHFANAVTVAGGKLIHLSGQLSPEGDLAAQFKGVYGNLALALAACGAAPADVSSVSASSSSIWCPNTGNSWSRRWRISMAAPNRRARWSASRP
jgi:enamine deaminase RidA (YjgF/YER057c/UK114 family)